ncbi:hypothetical protein [Saccharopolyspora mangrovi]|uniref:Uncharacterized protein n=1 Tax=Saccharopolyspora mangrovi TaxID=3082379 RepID=A0ABU6A731_9PSEU|nr:hypothetical protein [Saccharopolyspora sp. S2-29]MEB3367373.1 hypothetical protein [Saccharopolyspora sp. S2-29]
MTKQIQLEDISDEFLRHTQAHVLLDPVLWQAMNLNESNPEVAGKAMVVATLRAAMSGAPGPDTFQMLAERIQRMFGMDDGPTP